jgi:Delta7-sterol 5-desaturase
MRQTPIRISAGTSMIDSLVAQWRALPWGWALAVAYGIQLAIYAGIATLVALPYAFMHRVLGRGALLDPRPLRPGQVRRELGWALSTCGVYAVCLLVCLRLSQRATPQTWATAVPQFGALTLFYDLCIYWMHRLMHTRRLRAFHGVHHRSVRPTVWSVHSLHPLEALSNQLPILLFMLLWPAPVELVILFQALAVMLGGAVGHSNFDPYGKAAWLRPLKRYNAFHQRHHQFSRDNFGFAGPHWDLLFGTAERPAPELQ